MCQIHLLEEWALLLPEELNAFLLSRCDETAESIPDHGQSGLLSQMDQVFGDRSGEPS